MNILRKIASIPIPFYSPRRRAARNGKKILREMRRASKRQQVV